ncbi:hypothetical protein [Burkholderia latens]|uniref:hypothetical protein n=1 Tax=Burkholderia latens TaxID=488446 RepID=UPI001FC8477F|nr:hypothetical protein [Burkholderia latens]
MKRVRLARPVGEPFEFEGHLLRFSSARLGVCVGLSVAMLSDDGTDMNALIEHADRARCTR